MNDTHFLHDVEIPVGGWGSAKAILELPRQEQAGLPGIRAVLHSRRPASHRRGSREGQRRAQRGEAARYEL